MNLNLLRFSPGLYFAPAVDWLNTNFHPVFDAITKLIEAVLGALESGRQWLRPLVLPGGGWRAFGLRLCRHSHW